MVRRSYRRSVKKRSNKRSNGYLYHGKMVPTNTTKKQQIFTEVLIDADNALKEAGISYHLHSGSALGAIRSNSFIEHDHDIDLGVFREDYKRNLVSIMKKHGFIQNVQNGLLKNGKEYTFTHIKNDINVDIFLVYKDRIKDKTNSHNDIFYVASFYGKCDNMLHGFCRWWYRPYIPESVLINGLEVLTMPINALEDAYGPNWRIPKVFGYFEGLDQGHYTNLIDE